MRTSLETRRSTAGRCGPGAPRDGPAARREPRGTNGRRLTGPPRAASAPSPDPAPVPVPVPGRAPRPPRPAGGGGAARSLLRERGAGPRQRRRGEAPLCSPLRSPPFLSSSLILSALPARPSSPPVLAAAPPPACDPVPHVSGEEGPRSAGRTVAAAGGGAAVGVRCFPAASSLGPAGAPHARVVLPLLPGRSLQVRRWGGAGAGPRGGGRGRCGQDGHTGGAAASAGLRRRARSCPVPHGPAGEGMAAAAGPGRARRDLGQRRGAAAPGTARGR